MTVTINEYDPDDGSKGAELTVLGQLIGFVGTPGASAGIYASLTITTYDPLNVPKVPGPPALSGSVISRTQQNLAWTAYPDAVDVPAVTDWDLEFRTSTDAGSTWSAWAAASGSPFAAATLASNRTGLAAGTPEIVFEWRVRGSNSIGDGAWSNVRSLQYAGAPVEQPAAPTALSYSNLGMTSVRLAWSVVTDASVTKQGIFANAAATTPLVDNLGSTITSYDWAGLTAGQTFTGLVVKRYNGQWSPASNAITFTTLTETPVTVEMLIGASQNNASPGGFSVWDGYRVYNRSDLYAQANKSGSARPKFIAYSEQGANLGDSNPVYNTVYNAVLNELNTFYYDNTASTQSARWAVRLFWSNGNENYDKGALSPAPSGTTGHTDDQVARFTVSQQAGWDAVHYAPGGTRRFPNASWGSNPTTEAERLGYCQKYLGATARYHDFVMWSMYPPGRGVSQPTWARNPRWDWPTLVDSQWAHTQLGWLTRCYRRTKAMQTQARIDTGNPTLKIQIGCGEVGIASNPDDRACRPYYAVHALFGNMWQLATQYNLEMPFACWWDSKTAEDKPHNILTDEPPTSDHLSFGQGNSAGNNSVAANPSTAEAIRNWKLYDKRQPGSSQPAQWTGFPRPIVATQAAAGLTPLAWWVQYGTPI